MKEFYNLLPEFTVLIFACMVLLVPLLNDKNIYRKSINLCLFGLILAFIFVINNLSSSKHLVFDGHLQKDMLSDLFKLSVLLITIFCFLYAKKYYTIRKFMMGESPALLLFSLLGIFILISSHTLLSLYMGLELFSLPLYALVAIVRKDEISAEAAMKYFVTGAMASGFLLYGISLVYGVTGTINHAEIFTFIQEAQHNWQLILILGMVMTISGAVFKLGAAPFHMWLPDVYTGAPIPITQFIASVAKIAALGLLLKITVEIFNNMYMQWHDILTIIAVLSIGIGNTVAIVQTNIRRLLAYSAIAHAGYLILGLISGTAAGYAASIFYAITYALTVGCFMGIITILSTYGEEIIHINQLKGLNLRSPWLAFIILVLVLSLAGIPPLLGFYGKLFVISAIINSGDIYLAVYAMLMAVIGVFYYLNIIKTMYFDTVGNVLTLEFDAGEKVLININFLLIIILGFLPGFFFSYCLQVLS